MVDSRYDSDSTSRASGSGRLGGGRSKLAAIGRARLDSEGKEISKDGHGHVDDDDQDQLDLVEEADRTPSIKRDGGRIRRRGGGGKGRNRIGDSPVPHRSSHPTIQGCRSVYCYERLNHIEEGSYGVVFRARDKETGEIVALKKLKMDKEKNGFPITSLREIRTLMEARHPNVVQVKEIVVGDTLTQIFIVMEFVEHDLKTLLSNMRTPFLQSEIKTLMRQLLSAIDLLHSNWIIHRDLKTSNLLMNNRGMMKLADFGLARMFGDPVGDMTQLVVTLWYRAPELLLGVKEYGTAIDMWSVGCIFAELILKEPLLTGKNESDQILRIFKLLGQPDEASWPGYSSLPSVSSLSIPSSIALPSSDLTTKSRLRSRFRYSTENTLDLLSGLLCYDPSRRLTAADALRHDYFKESPLPAHPDTFGSFPSVAAGEKGGFEKVAYSPPAPQPRLGDQKLAYQLEFDLS
ncbi:Pkinase-domain-containing protein [Violaceomyces palustris]|uniref:Pkinase-domain-containing protein n=1 Tax=Violaceomyces palustris TaxID=1673888 RepID=A0ACD0NTV3_9BASI|nr:Pkinase-domain-containing protein [Violaceomyces palustris]